MIHDKLLGANANTHTKYSFLRDVAYILTIVAFNIFSKRKYMLWFSHMFESFLFEAFLNSWDLHVVGTFVVDEKDPPFYNINTMLLHGAKASRNHGIDLCCSEYPGFITGWVMY